MMVVVMMVVVVVVESVIAADILSYFSKKQYEHRIHPQHPYSPPHLTTRSSSTTTHLTAENTFGSGRRPVENVPFDDIAGHTALTLGWRGGGW